MNKDAAEALAQLAPMGAVEALEYWQEYRHAPAGWVAVKDTDKLAIWLWEHFPYSLEWIVAPIARRRIISKRLYDQYLKQHPKT